MITLDQQVEFKTASHKRSNNRSRSSNITTEMMNGLTRYIKQIS